MDWLLSSSDIYSSSFMLLMFFFQTAVFCTGGRDGNIMVWDIRCSQKGELSVTLKGLLQFCNFIGILSKDIKKNLTNTPFSHLMFCPTDGFYKQVKQISGAHNKSETNPSSKVKKKRSSMRGMAPSVVSLRTSLRE